MGTVDIRNLSNGIQEAKEAALDADPGPAEPLPYKKLRARLENAESKIPRLYREAVLIPYRDTLDRIGEASFKAILQRDPKRVGQAGLMLDIAQAILQYGEEYEPSARCAFQEVVSDLYDGFLSAEDRRGVAPPDREVSPPLVKFGNPESGPYTWPVDATSSFGLRVGVVNLPPANARRGLLAWPALGHETGGHDILHADTGLLREASLAVRAGLQKDPLARGLAPYWASRIDETASDVLGILNMGPAPGIGLIGYFRALDLAFGGLGKLRNDGPRDDPHPADIVRGYLAAATVKLLDFVGAEAWAEVISAETEKDLGTIQLEGHEIDAKTARRSAEIVAQVLVTHPMASLEEHAFGQIQNWRDADEAKVRRLSEILTGAEVLPEELRAGTYAAHLVAATTVAALAQDAKIKPLFSGMLRLLKDMNERNPSFGPLGVRRPGNLVRERVYLR